ncbi:MAG: tetratricopeptide repeat protein [Candidatus Firestonebacteria bacterium]
MTKILSIIVVLFATALFAETADECFKKGVEQANQGHYGNAISQLKRALELSPGFAEYHLNLGIVYANDKKYDSAISEVEASVKMNPNNGMAYYVLAMLYEKKRIRDKAIEAWGNVLRFNPSDDLKETATKHLKRLKEKAG